LTLRIFRVILYSEVMILDFGHQNICKFIPPSDTDQDINVLNFVYEANWNTTEKIYKTAFLLCLVTSGHGRYITAYGSFELKAGDLFFIFSTQQFRLLNENGLTFCYITFIGTRVHPLLDRLSVRFDQPYYSGYEMLIPFWKDAINRADASNIDLIAHSVLYHTFSFIASAAYEHSLSENSSALISEIRKYLDSRYRDPGLTLASVSADFGYSSKYISSRFSSIMKISITEYITSRRMDYASAMISEGGFSVSQIAEACGYNDPLYFSKVFKKHFGKSPSEVMKKR